MKRLPKKSYFDKFKAIKSYVSFSYKDTSLKSKNRLTRKAKLKITKYYNEVLALKSRPHQIYRTTSATRLQTAQNYSGHLKKLPYLKVAFIPKGEGDVKVRFKDNKIYVQEMHVVSTEIMFDTKALLTNPKQYVKKAIKSSKAKSFSIMAGRYEIPNTYDKSALPEAVEYLTTRYGSKEVILNGIKRRNNHYVENWLFGVRAHSYKKQASFDKYNKAKKKAISEAKKQRRKKRG